ncbi:hypothetical protein VKT23_014345 [Stygiomarasmius scandens]|uniref:HET-domain-containing protein n=1 Tax=Marasmiellus scandens TaxID=2682957 RepID=A0ABR1J3R2_9AGAR
MHLLHTTSFKLTEFAVDINIPPYAILSHTWNQEEVTFLDIQNLDIAHKKAGWSKVNNACAHAQKYHFEWIWIDCCCINKGSSAELSEALNSMYQYYLDAHVCYVYLSDAPQNLNPRDAESAFRRSKWFTRGWTLQELLAPTYVVFLDMDWVEIGTKYSLRDPISEITSIPVSVLEDGSTIDNFSIAQRMSWAAHRQTTRPEDLAYCLLGMFNINMSPIYGEGGARAFMRLQQEIIRVSDDRSIFAWIASPHEIEPRGLLARSPYEFRASGNVVRIRFDLGLDKQSSFSFNNNGLHIQLPLFLFHTDQYLAFLHCQSEIGGGYLAIYLQKMKDGKQYIRCRPSELILTSSMSATVATEEVVVMENQPNQRRSKRAQKFPNFELLPPPADSGIVTDSRDATGKDSLSSDDYDSRLEKSWTFTTNHNFGDGEQQDFDRFTVIFRCTKPWFEFKIISGTASPSGPADPEEIACFPFSADRTSVTRLKNGKALALSFHVTPLRHVWKINYLFQEAPSVPSLMTSLALSSPELGVLLPSGSGPLILLNVFPSDRFLHLDDKDRLFVPVSGNVTDPRTISYILTYKLRSNEWIPSVIFVGFGFHKNKVWTDTTIIPNEEYQPELVRQIWNSYLDNGSRAGARLRNQNSSSFRVSMTSSGPWAYEFTVEAKNLGRPGEKTPFNAYFLDFKVREVRENTRYIEARSPFPQLSLA